MTSAARLFSPAFALIRTSRPLGWIAAFCLFQMGMAASGARHSPVTHALSVALTFPFCLFLFGINDLADLPSDQLNPRKGNWLHGASALAPTFARYAPWAGALTVFAFCFLIPWRAGLVLFGILVVSWMYSSPPVRLKEVPIVDGLVTATIMVGLVLVGHFMMPEPPAVPMEVFMVAPTLAGLHIFASVADEASDRTAGHPTLAVRLGPMKAAYVSLGLSCVGAASVWFLSYAQPIAVYMILQTLIIAAWVVANRRFPMRWALGSLGGAGLLTLGYSALTYAL